METLLLNRNEIESLLNPLELYPHLVEGFKLYSLNREIAPQRANSSLPTKDSSAMILFPGLSSNVPAYTVKVHAKFPQSSPAIKGVINLHDIETGHLLAIMDSTYITAVRTGLSCAIGTHMLANSHAKKVAIIGAGVQGQLQLRSLSYLRELTHVNVYDTNKESSKSFAHKMKEELNIPIRICKTIQETVDDCDIIILATWSREPFLFSSMIKEGIHITTLGPDEPGKCEVSAELIKKSTFVCDDKDLSIQMGAIGGAGLSKDDIYAEIGEIISEKKTGRINDKQITIYGSVGLAFQDLISAWYVYQRAKKLHKGRYMNFLG
ncbi:ornithine cyclodeaminase family protein [Alkalicoccobacillus porphyridii]|uniref:Ornithine cyclodeaminase family protein n=1 Tax=Alkalicoccobacillus porphyridii TaxID=2597270 RepID=A0A553ZWQ6_9BACI|nr:ornithine cyclodeaminase family protein [Alkalicoccobacillus porphyridii]TSB45884.1 ornithine cyclodeaminase family protein [Alkalicoccobacillus porphyridii]